MIQQLLVNGIVAGSVYALIALGFSVIYQTVRFFHFAHGAVYTFGAYFAYFYVAQLSIMWPVAFPLACLSTVLLGVMLEILIYKPMRIRKATELTFLIASLGLYIVLQNLISMIWGDDRKSIRTGVVEQGYEILGARITGIQISIILASIVLITTFSILLWKTKFGKTLRALANNKELAMLCGVNTNHYIIYAHALGALLAAAASIMISLDTDMGPTMGFNALIMGVIAVIVGGIGSIAGAGLGGLLLGLVQNLGVWKLPSQWQATIAFAVLILFLLLRPYGILGRRLRSI